MTPPMLRRLRDQPIIDRDDVADSNAVFNPGAVLTDEGTVLLLRVEDRRGLSSIYVARSVDGVDDWTVNEQPLLAPDPCNPICEWGFEDARVVWAEEIERFVITCTAYGPSGPCVYLLTTSDFMSAEHFGVTMPPEDKNASVFPRRIGGSWCMLHRPVSRAGVADIWLSHSDDLRAWRDARLTMTRRPGGWWDAFRIGGGPPPIETEHGWLLVYHGVRDTISGGIYRAGAALLDLEEPWTVIGRLPGWVLGPERTWEQIGDVPNVVFPGGATVVNGELRVYYGAADTSVGVAACDLDELLGALRADAAASMLR